MSTTRGSEMAGPTGRRYTVRRILAAWIGALAIASTGISTALAQAAPAANQLKDIQVQALSGDRLELRLVTSGAAPEPLAFIIDNPARISLDLQNTTLGLDKRRKDVNVGPLSTILAAEAGGKTRVVLNLDKMVPYTTRVDGNAIVVTLGAAAAGASAVTSFPAAQAAPATAAAVSRSVSGVDFRRGDNGAGRVVITLSDPSTPVDVRKEGDRVVLSFNGATLPDSLQKRLDVTDFATPVNSIESVSTPSGTRISIAATPPFEELAYQSDSVFSVEIAPVVAVEKDTKPTLFDPAREYTGERLTLSFQDIETRAVLQLLADVSGRNIIVSDSVAGNVTLRLQNVPWDQALDIVLATKGLDMRENGGVIIVAPADEIAAREKADLEARKDIRELEPLLSEFLQVNYAKASDLAELMKGTGGATKGNAMLSERGSVAIDERTNTLLVQDVSENLAQIRRLVSTLDIPVRQVLIESRIVIVNDDFSRELGIRWGVTAVNDTSDGLIAVSGSNSGTNTIVNSALDNLQNTGSPYPVQLPAQGDRYNVNLPIANPAGRLGLALLGEDFLVDLELSAAQAEGRGEVISSPRVITANQKEASIRQGVEIPYQESSSSGATSTQFKEAVLSLTVTPQITPDDRIILDLTVTKDSVGQVVSDERGGSIPSIDTREVVTQVLVNNGQTVVLGGVYETEEGQRVSKVPFLGDIPGLGVLFRSTRTVSRKSELLIFVTPKILKEGSNIY
jgi:type IV pilus assembly protein PilQ